MDILKCYRKRKPGNFILTYEVSRLGRSNMDNSKLWDDLVEKKGCTIVSLSQGIDSRNESLN